MGKLLATVGLARSGKTTYSKKWLAEQMEKRIPSIVVDTDIIRTNIHGHRFLKMAEPFVLASEHIVVTSFLDGYDVMYAETNTSENSIRKVLGWDINAEFIYFNASPGLCKERALETDQADLVYKGVIDRHWHNLLNLTLKYADIHHSIVGEKSVLSAIENIRKEMRGK